MNPAGRADNATVLYEKRGAVRLLTINRAERMNAIGPVESRGLFDALGQFRDDETASVLVITGAGSDAFCSGADLLAATAMYRTDLDVEPLFDPSAGLDNHPIPAEGNIGPTRWTDIHKPIIAAVNGAAYAGGLEWACLANLRIADEHASFGVTCRRWNVGLGDGGTQRLPRLIGMSRAMDLIITGRVIGAREAERFGLVNEVTPSGRCLDRAMDLAESIADLPQPALRTDMEAAVRGFGRPLDEGLAIEAECFNRLIGQPELKIGTERFLDRDHPDRRPGARPLFTPAKAYSFAEQAHRETPGKFGSDIDFITHPAGVASVVAEYGDEETVCAAYLHDTIEKSPVTAAEIGREFGPVVKELVVAVTDDPSIEDPDQRRSEHRARALDGGERSRLIYAADRLDGIRQMTAMVVLGRTPSPAPAAVRAASWREDIEMLRERGIPAALLGELERAIDELDASILH